MTRADLKALVRTIPDFPKPGILFRDITTLLLDGPGFAAAVDEMVALARPHRADLVGAIEARGFLFGAAIAKALGIGILPVRKANKLPGARIGIDYALEYGTDRLEIHQDALAPGHRILVIDDLIATGGTALATVQLLRQAGAEVAAALFVIDLPDLGGADRLRAEGVDCLALLEFPGSLSFDNIKHPLAGVVYKRLRNDRADPYFPSAPGAFCAGAAAGDARFGGATPADLPDRDRRQC